MRQGARSQSELPVSTATGRGAEAEAAAAFRSSSSGIRAMGGVAPQHAAAAVKICWQFQLLMA